MDAICYYRVSTQRQNLGLDAQRQSVAKWVQSRRSPVNILNSYHEKESGRNNHRPELMKAIDETKRKNATLLVAQLDRLSRSIGFIFTLRDSGVKFIACDIPDANTMTLGVLASVAQHEREIISRRIKDALRIRKMQGKKLGNPQHLTQEARQKGANANRLKAQDNRQRRQLVSHIRALGPMPYHRLAKKLNEDGFTTPTQTDFKTGARAGGKQFTCSLAYHYAHNSATVKSIFLG